MNILYGVSGEGFGHSSRAIAIASHLKKKGHKILFLTYGQAYEILKKENETIKVNGLHIIFKGNLVKKRKTFSYNMKHFSKNFINIRRIYKKIKEFSPDIFISDFEPIVPILSFFYRKPLISVDNQHILTNTYFDVPSKYKKDYLLAREITRFFSRNADYFIIPYFTKAKIKEKNTLIVDPIIRKEVLNLKSKYGKKILVYLTKPDNNIIENLNNIDQEFLVYGYNIEKEKGKILFKTPKTFLEDLKDCKAVIATAGLTLITEAIYLKKPFFAIPLKGHFEQTLNAMFLKDSGLGNYSDNLQEKEIISFLKDLDIYKSRLKNYKFNNNEFYNVLDGILKKYSK